jgi:hypothetical protein
MPASEFVVRWTALSKLGKAALTDPDFTAIQNEVGAAARLYRAEINSAQDQGRIPRSCPPSKVSVSAEDLALEIKKLPPESQLRELRLVFGEIMDHRYPCPTTPPILPVKPTT